MLIDPIGFGFEHFDAIGRWRDKENDRAVDASGHFHVTDDINGPFNGTAEMAQKLANSKHVQRCFVRQWYRYAFSREDTPNDACFVNTVSEDFVRKGGDIRELLVSITAHKIFAHLTGELSDTPGKTSLPLTANPHTAADCSAFSFTQHRTDILFFLLSFCLAWIAIRRQRSPR